MTTGAELCDGIESIAAWTDLNCPEPSGATVMVESAATVIVAIKKGRAAAIIAAAQDRIFMPAILSNMGIRMMGKPF